MTTQQESKAVVIIMTYGVLHQSLTFDPYAYMSVALLHLEAIKDFKTSPFPSGNEGDFTSPIYLGGGATDPSRPGETEAETWGAACRVVIADLLQGRRTYLLPKINAGQAPWTQTAQAIQSEQRKVHVHPHGLDAREVLEYLSRAIPANIERVRIYCAHSHQDLVTFLGLQIFSSRVLEVVPLLYPPSKGPFSSSLARVARIPRTLLGVAAWYSPLLRRLEVRLRAWHMRRHAAHPDALK